VLVKLILKQCLKTFWKLLILVCSIFQARDCHSCEVPPGYIYIVISAFTSSKPIQINSFSRTIRRSRTMPRPFQTHNADISCTFCTGRPISQARKRDLRCSTSGISIHLDQFLKNSPALDRIIPIANASNRSSAFHPALYSAC